MIKQVIVIRNDLNMRKGKMVTQGSHASMKVFFDRMEDAGDDRLELGPQEGWDWLNAVKPWIEGIFTKSCVRVDSEAEFFAIEAAAKAAGLPCAAIQDSGLTEFKGVPTWTALAIGPAEVAVVDKITGHLKLL
jgi:PTH2 family peptidyl-tRNA hydrolase